MDSLSHAKGHPQRSQPFDQLSNAQGRQCHPRHEEALVRLGAGQSIKPLGAVNRNTSSHFITGSVHDVAVH